MKTILKSTTLLLALGLAQLATQAAVLFQDNFDSYSQGELPTNSVSSGNGPWYAHSGSGLISVIADPSGNTANALQVSQALTVDVHAFVTNSSYPTLAPTGSVVAVYSSYTLNMQTLPTGSAYFSHFYRDSSTFSARVFVTNNGAGGFRVGIANGGGNATPVLPTDLSLNTTYTIVTRFVPSSGISTLWLNPTTEASSSITATDAPNAIAIVGYAFRQNTGEGVMAIDSLIIGTSFTNVVPASTGFNPPFIGLQPSDIPVVITNQNASFTNSAGGDPIITYRWYFTPTNTIPGVIPTNFVLNNITTNAILSLTNVTTNATGYYYCIASNAVGTATTRYALLSVFNATQAPVITNQPASGTYGTGDSALLSVVAGGVPPPTYQWKYVPVTNLLLTNIISGANAATLSITNLSTNYTGNKYFVVISNYAGSVTSTLATLTVNPVPQVSIASLRAMVDAGTLLPTNTTTLYTIQGTVTTWSDMTSSGNTEFYMQDATAGIAVFWSGAPSSTNLPPAGAIVQVTGPMANFNGLLELSPVFSNPLHGVKIISTNNPLPQAQPLPFDPNVAGTAATMEKLEGSYFVASNVTLLAGSTITSGANEFITNNAYHVRSDTVGATVTFTNDVGQTFTVFWNAYTDIPGKTKPTGPVTIYGVLGNFKGLYEFTPSRYADIISYSFTTNVLTNARKADAPTNTYSEIVLRPGETLASQFTVGDPEGGTVTLAPVTDGLPATATWSGVANGSTGKAVLNYTPAAGDAGNDYIFQLGVASSSGNTFTNTMNVYVPTADEQAVAITEILANPVTNTASAAWNPLHRSTDTLGVATNDEYIEIANQSPDTIGLVGWSLYGNGVKIEDFNVNGPSLGSSNSVVVYGGNVSEAVNLPVYGENATSGKLGLSTNGGSLVLRNASGYVVDRVVYAATDLATNGSISRFPTINSAFVPQTYISTNLATAGLQYDGGSWGDPTKDPTGVSGVTISKSPGSAVLKFPATTTQAFTLWSSPTAQGPYSVIYGQPFLTTTGAFTNTNPANIGFYYITTQ